VSAEHNPAMQVELDRARAIRLALGAAGSGDVVLLAGKGHEDYQEIAGRRLPFSDAREAQAALGDWPAGLSQWEAQS
jgi:UDP-N-acetylmuramoyl-L-alanyl-D-glutamate--2,6-diaminopimelate ligase